MEVCTNFGIELDASSAGALQVIIQVNCLCVPLLTSYVNVYCMSLYVMPLAARNA